MAVGKHLKKNFYSNNSGDIEMPPLGEIPPVLADSPELFSKQELEAHPMVRNNNVEEHDDVEPESSVSDVDSDNDDQAKEEQGVVQVPQQKQKNKTVDENLRSLREARERAEWERDTLKNQMLEMQRALQGQYSSQMPQQKPVQEPEVDDFNFDVADDALLEGKHAKQLVQELKKVKKELRQFHSQSSETAIESKIRSSFPDFDQVVSKENVDRLNREYPEIAQTLRDTPDLYNKASSAYSIMKKFGIHKDMIYEEDKMKAIKNSQKPRPVASVSPQQGDSPLSKANAFANGLSKDLQKQLLAEMAAARKGM